MLFNQDNVGKVSIIDSDEIRQRTKKIYNLALRRKSMKLQRAKKEETQNTFDILLVVMVIKANRKSKSPGSPQTQLSQNSNNDAQSCQSDVNTLGEWENLQIKSFATLIGYFCDWLLEIWHGEAKLLNKVASNIVSHLVISRTFP